LLWAARLPTQDITAIMPFHGPQGLLGLRNFGGHDPKAKQTRWAKRS
jgi:hypothetical protein